MKDVPEWLKMIVAVAALSLGFFYAFKWQSTMVQRDALQATCDSLQAVCDSLEVELARKGFGYDAGHSLHAVWQENNIPNFNCTEIVSSTRDTSYYRKKWDKYGWITWEYLDQEKTHWRMHLVTPKPTR